MTDQIKFKSLNQKRNVKSVDMDAPYGKDLPKEFPDFSERIMQNQIIGFILKLKCQRLQSGQCEILNQKTTCTQDDPLSCELALITCPVCKHTCAPHYPKLTCKCLSEIIKSIAIENQCPYYGNPLFCTLTQNPENPEWCRFWFPLPLRCPKPWKFYPHIPTTDLTTNEADSTDSTVLTTDLPDSTDLTEKEGKLCPKLGNRCKMGYYTNPRAIIPLPCENNPFDFTSCPKYKEEVE